MSLQYKAYLYEGRPCKFKEIRRFTVDNDVCTSYEYLRTKVASVFPNLDANFSLQWKDSDGDFIWFNSDEELMQALDQYSPGGVFKLFIKVQNGGNGKKEKESSDTFPNFSQWQSHFGNFNPNNCHRFPYGWGQAQEPFGWGVNPGCPMRNNPPAAEQNEPPSQDQPQKPSKPEQDGGMNYLKHMGNAVANLLQPFGVDVDINVEHKGERSKCTGSQPSPSAPPPPPATSSPESPPTESQKQPPPAPNSGETESFSPPEKEDQGCSSDPEWTFLKPEDGDKSHTQPKSPEVTMETDDDIRLRTALDSLVAMGFTENEWLVSLLKSCDYSIEKVLDALQPGSGSYRA